MELKFCENLCVSENDLCSNRTFMELKFNKETSSNNYNGF